MAIVVIGPSRRSGGFRTTESSSTPREMLVKPSQVPRQVWLLRMTSPGNDLIAAVPAGVQRPARSPAARRFMWRQTVQTATRRSTGAALLTFQPLFGTNVAAVINRIFDSYGIATGVCANGDRRTFQTQYQLLTSGRNVTHAGPGESNHNFGQAVDLGFEGLRWLRADGTPVDNETSWLHALIRSSRQ